MNLIALLSKLSILVFNAITHFIVGGPTEFNSPQKL